MAKKYIDAEKLKAEIERLKDEYTDIAIDRSRGWVNANYVIEDLEQLQLQIHSLQQEQQEVDLEKEIDKEWKKCNPVDEGMGVESAYMHIEAFDIIARHFYELGKNSK